MLIILTAVIIIILLLLLFTVLITLVLREKDVCVPVKKMYYPFGKPLTTLVYLLHCSSPYLKRLIFWRI